MTIKNIRLVGLDLDGTVFNEAKEITPAVREAIKKAIERGITVIPATGRPVSGLPEAFISIPGVRYALTSNGAAVVDLKTGRRVHEDCIDSGWAAKIVGTMLEFDGLAEVYVDGLCYTDEKNFRRALNFAAIPDALKEYMRKTRNPVADIQGFLSHSQSRVEKLHMMFDDPKVREAAFERLRGRYPQLTITEATSFNMEINAPTANKGSGLLALGQYLGIPRTSIMACGGSGNDYAMIHEAGYSVAMGNATEKIKAAADFVTKTNEEDGVAFVLNMLA